MLREFDCGDDTAVPAGDGPMGDMQTPRLAGSDVPEERASAGALPPRSSEAGRSSADEREPADTAPERKSPLIRAVEIENFKGIGRPVRIELRPITLLFGRNSAGKSTVLHALCVFLIETHSEHLFLRIMRRMRETSGGTLPEGAPEVRREDVNVVFVEPDGAETLIREMPLNERGELVKAWPGGFFEEDLREIF